ncbi:hypothetical protein [Allorhizobium undicola]|uniref:hypothetical protein n=1 Tax=Allorhizobium undicola TaxID=78527 RepID=UPI00047FA736|nr:hypothetical protein [Allorhizobium undicola]
MSRQKSEAFDLREIANEIIEDCVPALSDMIRRSSPLKVTVMDRGLTTGFNDPAVGCFYQRAF